VLDRRRHEVRATHRHQEVDDREQRGSPHRAWRREVPDDHSAQRDHGGLSLGAVVEHDAENHHESKELESQVPVIPIAHSQNQHREDDCSCDQLYWPRRPGDARVPEKLHRARPHEPGFAALERAPGSVLIGKRTGRDYQQRERKQH